jgi:hypothetical protein
MALIQNNKSQKAKEKQPVSPKSSWEEFMKGPTIGDDFERLPQPPMQMREDDHDE